MDPTCETILENGKVCGDPGHSLSDEHDGMWKCRACYYDWLKTNKPGAYLGILVKSSRNKNALAQAITVMEGGKM